MTHLQKVAIFELVRNPSSQTLGGAHLLLQGHPTGRKIKGRLLVDQYSWGKHYLLISSDDNPYEEVLHIYLLDSELNKLDEMDLSQPGMPGIYQPCHHSKECLEFRFFDQNTWCLSIRHKPKARALNMDQFPISRPVKLWGQQYLRLEKQNHSAA